MDSKDIEDINKRLKKYYRRSDEEIPDIISKSDFIRYNVFAEHSDLVFKTLNNIEKEYSDNTKDIIVSGNFLSDKPTIIQHIEDDRELYMKIKERNRSDDYESVASFARTYLFCLYDYKNDELNKMPDTKIIAIFRYIKSLQTK
jgi:hypothetical protein